MWRVMRIPLQKFGEMTINNIYTIWVPVWQWPIFLVFFIGLFGLLFGIAFILFLVFYFKRSYLENRKIVASLTMSIYGSIYFVWFLIFTLIIWHDDVLYSIYPNIYRYSVGPWLIVFIVLIPAFFLFFSGNLVWFLKLRKKQKLEQK